MEKTWKKRSIEALSEFALKNQNKLLKNTLESTLAWFSFDLIHRLCIIDEENQSLRYFEILLPGHSVDRRRSASVASEKVSFFLEGQNIAKTFHKYKLNHSLKMEEQILSLLIIKVHIFYWKIVFFAHFSISRDSRDSREISFPVPTSRYWKKAGKSASLHR